MANIADGVDTTYFKRLVTWAKEKMPSITDAEVIEAEKWEWSSGGSQEPSGNVYQLIRLMSKENLTEAIGSTEQEFGEYAQMIGQC